MMKLKTRLLAIATLSVVVAGMSPNLEAGWIHQENAVYLGKDATEKHPALVEQNIVMPLAAETPLICIVYANNSKKAAKAKISTLVTIEDPAGEEQTLIIGVRVRKHSALKCIDGPDLNVGDMVRFDHVFEKFSRLRSDDDNKQGFAITGLVSTADKPSLGAGPLALAPLEGSTPLGLIQSGKSGWFHSANSVYHVTKKNEEHPTSIIRAIVMPKSSGRKPWVCSGYSRSSSDEQSAGKVKTVARIGRSDGSIETLDLSGAVKKDQHLDCVRASRKILKGDIVAFDSDYKSMPDLDKAAFADLVGAVTSTGEPAFRSEQADDPLVPNSPPTSPPPPGSTLTAADESAITRMFTGIKNQLIRPKGNNPAKWEVVGPRTLVDSSRHIIPSTAGYGSTPAAAVADYEKKRGSLGGKARSLTSAERTAWEWYSAMNSAAGPTAIRRDGSGAWRGDAYRPGIGVQISGPLGDVTRVVSFLRSLGL